MTGLTSICDYTFLRVDHHNNKQNEKECFGGNDDDDDDEHDNDDDKICRHRAVEIKNQIQ